MDTTYVDQAGTQHSVHFHEHETSQDRRFLVYKDGSFVCDLVTEDGIWMEPFHGATSKAAKFGSMLEIQFGKLPPMVTDASSRELDLEISI
ncbi:MAG: hypothetical protein EOO02_21420 [Chitinophagaceae bacterium]|nr:MAG: hypothetical protein EOO02_21420 [Chitinophagaceae bacterium]